MTILDLNLDLRQQGEALVLSQQGGEVLFSETDQQRASPQVLWMSNVMPTKRGMTSTCEVPQITVEALPIGSTEFLPTKRHNVKVVYDGTGASTYFMYRDGDYLVFNPTSGTWTALLVGATDLEEPDVAFLKGKSYVFHPTLGVATFDAAFSGLTVETLSGVVAANLLGIASANNYLIAWDADTIYWSSPTDPLEFVPVVATVKTGAGSAKIQQVRGVIQSCLPTSDGLIIYTNKNAVSMRYSGNADRPWVWKEVKNSSGVLNTDHVSTDSNTSIHFSWTASGLHRLDSNSASSVFPEISDFLAGGEYLRLLDNSNLLEQVIANNIDLKVALINSRYLCISYGKQEYFKEFVLVFDLALERWGKIKSDHLDLFQYEDPTIIADTGYDALTLPYSDYGNVQYKYLGKTSAGTSINPSTLGLLKPDGSIHKVELAKSEASGMLEVSGELLIGEIKVARGKNCMLSVVQLHGTPEDTTISVETRSTHGDVPVAVLPDPSISGRYLMSTDGNSHKLRLSGKFSISNIVLSLLQTGYM